MEEFTVLNVLAVFSEFAFIVGVRARSASDVVLTSLLEFA